MIVVMQKGTTGQIFEMKISEKGTKFIVPLDARKIMVAICAGPLLQNVDVYEKVVWDVGVAGKGFGWRKVK